MSTLTVAIDIGSTNLHCGLVDLDTLACITKTNAPRADWQQSLDLFFAQIKTAYPNTTSISIVIGGGRNGLAVLIETYLRERYFVVPIHITASGSLPFSISYTDAHPFGADRIASALYAHAQSPNETVILISSGTAVTVDLLTNGKLIAGGIFAGLNTQLQSLHKISSALPLVSPETIALQLPARSTSECICNGTFASIVGGTTMLVNELVNLTNENNPYGGSKESPIMLIGDSFTGVFESIDCKSAGVGANIAAQNGVSVEIITSWGGGPLIRKKAMSARANYLPQKKVVVYMMTMRDLYNYAGGWEVFP